MRVSRHFLEMRRGQIKVEIPKIERGAVYFGDGKPVKIADKNHYMFYIARNITTIVLSRIFRERSY